MLIVICIVSSVLLSLVLTEVRIRMSVGYAVGAYIKTNEAIEAIEKLDSTFIVN